MRTILSARAIRTLFLLLWSITLTSTLHALTPEQVEITVRDGARLAADVYREGSTVPKPVILVQTPYNRALYRPVLALQRLDRVMAMPMDTAAFHYVIVDWRGFYGSRDAAEAGYDRGLDGVDVIEWIREQPWSNGKVGTWGGSALGGIQFGTAKHQPEGLVCIVPMITDLRILYTDYYYGGALREAQVQALTDLGFITPAVIKSQPTYNLVWQSIEANNDVADQIQVPALMVSGWFDLYPDQVLGSFAELQQSSPANVRDQHRLIFGPWTHSTLTVADQGELSFPDETRVMIEASLRFLRHHLLDDDNGWEGTEPVRYYQLGAEEWRSGASWAGVVEETTDLAYYLRSGGVLQRSEASEDEESGRYTTDPRDPSPTHGGSLFQPLNPESITGPVDQRAVVESRGDVMIYTTPPLEEDLTVTGPITLNLFVETNRTDGDVAVRLTDVYPDGRSILLTQGVKRLRFREGLRPADTSLVTPGEIVEVGVELQNLAITFRRGHAIRIILTGTNWPHFSINPNTGEPLYNATDSLTATTIIHSGPNYPSRIDLPVVRSSSVEERSTLPPAWLDLTMGVMREVAEC